MPLFDFKCPKCGSEILDVLVKNSETSNPVCDVCKTLTSRVVPSKTSFQLKGQGWYKDGYSSPKRS